MTPRRLVLVDANVLINFAHVNRLDLLGALTDLEFRAPAEVLSEILSEPRKTLVEEYRSHGHLQEIPFSTVAELKLFTELRAMMGMGEAACLALARDVPERLHLSSRSLERELAGPGNLRLPPWREPAALFRVRVRSRFHPSTESVSCLLVSAERI